MKTMTKRSKKIGYENEEKRQQEKKLKTKQNRSTSQWKIKNKEIISKNLECTLEFHCCKCRKKLPLPDVFCIFDLNNKVKGGLRKGGLYSAFFCADCAKKNEDVLT